MRGLLIKDFLNMKRELIGIACIVSFYFIFINIGDFSLAAKSQPDIGFLFVMILVDAVILFVVTATLLSVFTYDERTNWQLFERTIPLNASKIVAEKYLIQFGGTFILAALCIVFNLNVVMKFGCKITSMVFIVPCAVCAVMFIQYSIIMPFIFKAGIKYSSALLISSMIISVIFVVVLFMFYYSNLDFLENVLKFWIYPIIAVVVAVAVFLSMRVSIRIYIKKYE